MRDVNGSELANTNISVKFSIRKNTFDGPMIFQENHQIIHTNQFGLFGAVIGEGVNTGLGVITSLADIDWSDDRYFLEVSAVIPGQGESQILGVSQLLAVPYSLYALRAESVMNEGDGDSENELIEDFSLQGNVLTIAEAGTEYSVDLSSISHATWNKEAGKVFNEFDKIGIGTALPNSSLSVEGSFSAKMIKTASPQFDMTSVNGEVFAVLCDVSSNNIQVNLPSAAGRAGRMYKFRKLFAGASTSNNVIITPPSGEMIDGVSSFLMNHTNVEYVTIISDGTGWYLIDHSKE